MQVSHQNIFEESASRTEYYFVCTNMLVIQCGKGNICKGLVIHIHNSHQASCQVVAELLRMVVAELRRTVLAAITHVQ